MHELVEKNLPEFLELLGLTEPPMALFWTDEDPEGFAPDPGLPPTREREERGEIDWQEVFGNFSCVIGHIWRARRKGCAAYFSAERYGCPGGSFFLGFHKPQTNAIINYVSSGTPGWSEGERYCESPRPRPASSTPSTPCRPRRNTAWSSPSRSWPRARRRRWSCFSPGPSPCAGCIRWPVL